MIYKSSLDKKSLKDFNSTDNNSNEKKLNDINTY